MCVLRAKLKWKAEKFLKSFPLIWVTNKALNWIPKTEFFHQWLRFLNNWTKVTLSARQTPFSALAAQKSFFRAKVAAWYSGLYYETFPVDGGPHLPNFHPSLPTFTTLGSTLFTKLKFSECFRWENMKRHKSLEKKDFEEDDFSSKKPWVTR